MPDPKTLDRGRLADELESSLWNDLLDPFFTRCIDPAGGFQQRFARDWTPIDDPDRGIVIQSRYVWTASTVARLQPDRRAEMEPIATHGLRFLEERFFDPQRGGFSWSVGLRGEPGNSDRYAYGLAFALYACSAAYRAFQSAKALALAQSAFDWLESPLHDEELGGWHERATIERQLRLETPRSSRYGCGLGSPVGFKVQNSHLHILEALTEFYRAAPSGLVRDRLCEALDAIAVRMFAEPGCLFSLMTRDWKPMPRAVSFGHDVESAYLVWEGATALGSLDDGLLARIRALVDHALAWGFDWESGGLAELGEALGRPLDAGKGWWTQAEALLAFILALTLWPDDEKYGQAVALQWQWIQNRQLDKQHPGWLPRLGRDGEPQGSTDKGGPWKACYHEGRALLYGARLLRALPLHEASRLPRD